MLMCFCCTTRSNLTLTTTFFGGHLEIKSPPHPPPRSLWRKPSAPGDYTVFSCQRNEKGARGWGTRRASSISPLLCVCHNSYTNRRPWGDMPIKRYPYTRMHTCHSKIEFLRPEFMLFSNRNSCKSEPVFRYIFFYMPKTLKKQKIYLEKDIPKHGYIFLKTK